MSSWYEAQLWTRRHTKWLLGIVLLALFMRAVLLGFPQGKFFDEIYYVPAAEDYLQGRPDANSVHPPMAKLQLAITVLFFDGLRQMGVLPLPEEVGWRLLPCLLGVGTVALSAWLGYALSRSPRIALGAALLVCIDHLSVAESRICTLDSIQTFWITLGMAAAAHRIFLSPRNGWVWLSAVAFGIATACKWNGLFAAGGAALAFWFVSRRGQRLPPEETPAPTEEPAPLGSEPLSGPAEPGFAPLPRRPHPLLVFVALALATVLIYVGSYIPFSQTPPERGKSVAAVATDVKAQHERMLKFRYDAKQFKHQYISPFYQWPFVVRPVWFHFKTADGWCSGIVAFGMLPFWWLSIYLLLEAVVSAWRVESLDPAGQFLVFNYLAQWLMWASSTTGGFFYYMLPVVPLMAVLVARQLSAWDADPETRRYARGYMWVLAIMTVLYFPFMSGISVPYKYFRTLFFIRRWY